MTNFTCQGCGKSLVKSWTGRNPKWCSERCRKGQYAGTCIDCGTTTNGYDGPGQASERCIPCRKEFELHDPSVRLRCSELHLGRLDWTDEQILAALRSAAVGGIVTKPHYDEMRRRSTDPMPSGPIIIRRFGSWSAAVAAAGFRASRHGNHAPRPDRITEDACIAAVQACIAALGEPPSVTAYNAWARGRDVPSSVTIRNRLGSWLRAIDRASDERRVAA